MAILSIDSASTRQTSNEGVEFDPMNSEGTTILLDKFSVETELFDIVESLFMDIYPSTLEGIEYSPQDLCGEEFWADMTSVGKRQTVLCLKHLATLPDVPLCDVSCSTCGTTSFQTV